MAVMLRQSMEDPMPSANKGGWKTCSRGHKYKENRGCPFDGRETAPPVVGARRRDDDFDPATALHKNWREHARHSEPYVGR